MVKYCQFLGFVFESLLHTGLKFQSDANFDVSNGQFYQNHKSLFSLRGESAVDQEACRSMYAKRLLSIDERFSYVLMVICLGCFSTWAACPLKEELLVYPTRQLFRAESSLAHVYQGE